MEQAVHDLSSPGPETPSLKRHAGTEQGRHHVPQKRPRPTKSCLLCRKKKLKCDRLAPCRQCIMRNVQCTYDQEEQPSPESRTTEELDVEGHRRRKIPIPELPREVRTYAGVPPGVSSTPETGDQESTRLIKGLQSQVDRLEQLIADQPHVSSKAPQRSSLCANHGAGSSTDPGTLTVKGARSRFHGRNQKRSLLKEVSPQARAYVGGFGSLLNNPV